MAGAIILESVFALPGLGRLALGAITRAICRSCRA